MSSSATSGARKQPTAVSRMKQDYMRLKRDPLPYITAEPLPNNILEWHYCVKGPEDSPYYGGYYHGTLLFPREFPFKPPSIYMLTPNGRFKTNTRLCLSISDFHPDTWNPTWCVGTILTGLLSFMLESTPTLGSIESSNYDKQMFAQKSLAFNLRNQNFCELFPDIVDEIKIRLHGTQGDPSKSTSSAGAATRMADIGTLAGAAPADLANGGPALQNSARNSYLNWQSVYSNLVIIICFAIFALIVNYVIKNLNQE
ncbi:ubiquitin-conjugating enzyme E2 J2 isoform X2 [Scaptodrosophila lebanonensis]|uniref:Ubiquitin-conjugating enzyme E2 J2 n=1 Tax=Drosophila lebanonensis TaxID=7225 RepID=A0A6J2T435_DROLE|nr:ubiquitin-conjugating enzyme E2 J2 isoform X2 [Scaptodrosophila lebanonensis]